jgi:uncharacterized protein YjbJ (UPF0337 family)
VNKDLVIIAGSINGTNKPCLRSLRHGSQDHKRTCDVIRGDHELESTMNEDRVIGTARNAAGKAQEGIGNAIGDARMQASGVANQVAGAAQDLYGQTRAAASDMANAAQNSASSFEKLVRNTIETQPYTAVFVALGIGWLIGRTHKPI